MIKILGGSTDSLIDIKPGCHCRACRKQIGGAFALNALIGRDDARALNIYYDMGRQGPPQGLARRKAVWGAGA